MTGRRLDDAAAQRARATIEQLFAASLAAVEPAAAVESALGWHKDTLRIGNAVIPAENGVHLVAVGKAAVAMARGAIAALGAAIVAGDVITKEGHATAPLPARLRVHQAGHPIPDERGARATSEALAALRKLSPGSVAIALISGGGSALLEAPREGISLDDLATTTNLLLRAGAPIEALNAVRAPLSQVKSGGLRSAAPAATWVTLILSDVLGNDPRTIASGPTVPGGRSAAAARDILDRFGVREQVPTAVLAFLERRELEDDAPDEPTGNSVVRIVGDNAAAVEAAASEARRLGFQCQIVWTAREGEAADLGGAWVEVVERALPSVEVLLGGGEATVTVRGDGLGGRNTEFALAAALELERRGTGDWTIASLATDGQDALTGMAGAIVDGDTARRARERGIDPQAALRRNDSLAVFERVGGAVETGPTGTNVNDLYFAVRMRDGRPSVQGE